MKQVLILALLFIAAAAKGQTISFAYDASGNRTAGNVTITKALSGGQDIVFEDVLSLEKASISISPNPTKGLLKIRIPDTTLRPVLQVVSLEGKTIAKITITDSYQDFDISSYPSGIYLFQITNGTEVETWKIIKQ